MKAIRRTYLLIMAALTVLWLAADEILSSSYEFFAFRESFVNYTAFFVKGLGDYTKTLPEGVKVGDLATVEGPYGFSLSATRNLGRSGWQVVSASGCT